ncbi:MAG: non-canonical purine NTP diphosphatase [Bacteroidales bacterium]|nr:non-canonical purine NTP diphosphatase [Bacteroidales bacterium]
MELVFATNNQHKLKEVQFLLGDKIKLLSLKDIGCSEEIPEDYETLKENASQKARYIYDRYKMNCFADDTGLEIDALNGEPGVYSARYAGEPCTFDDNNKKVLEKLQGIKNRKACFKTVISLILDGKEYFFEGQVDGEILTEKTGKDGFGYDPVFKPVECDLSFAEMSMEEKNKISHRARATKKLVGFLLK